MALLAFFIGDLSAHSCRKSLSEVVGHDGKGPVVSARALEFLHESNAIERIFNITYRGGEFAAEEGHLQAFVLSHQAALERRPLKTEDFELWQGLVTNEQMRNGHPMRPEAVGKMRSPDVPIMVRIAAHIPPHYSEVPQLFERLLIDLNHQVAKWGTNVSANEVANVMGEFHQRFQALHPFADGNGRVGRLLTNYIAVAGGLPLVIFKSADSAAFYAAHKSKAKMKRYIHLLLIRDGFLLED